jgi:hypothetical protein
MHRPDRRILRFHSKRNWRPLLRHQVAHPLFPKAHFRHQMCILRHDTFLHLNGPRTIRTSLQLPPARPGPLYIHSLPDPIPHMGNKKTPKKNPQKTPKTKQIRNNPNNYSNNNKLAIPPPRRPCKIILRMLCYQLNPCSNGLHTSASLYLVCLCPLCQTFPLTDVSDLQAFLKCSIPEINSG